MLFRFEMRHNETGMSVIEPCYIALFKSGELGRLADELYNRLLACDICPWKCGVNRIRGEIGFCQSGALPIVSSYCAHRGEEPALSGTRGSGTIFFGNCNMLCLYCQNFQISQDSVAQRHHEVDCQTLAGQMLYLQNKLECHNINLVSPSHFVPQIVKAVLEAASGGLHIPLVYNTGGYDSIDTIKALAGIIDIYLPDIRYASKEIAAELSKVPEYVVNNRQVIREMYRQVGDLKTDEDGVAYRGVIVRHLILPKNLAGSEDSLGWLAREVSPTITVSIMSQYYPCHKASQKPELTRTINCEEYAEVTNLLEKLGLENGWLQEMDAPTNYLPDFSRQGNPFE